MIAAPTRLSRRDRAAMVAALECLRYYSLSDEAEADSALIDALVALELPSWSETKPLWHSVNEVYTSVDVFKLAACRLLRARLALYLRAKLRADAGKWPEAPFLQCRRCGRDAGWPEYSQMVCTPCVADWEDGCKGVLDVRWRR